MADLGQLKSLLIVFKSSPDPTFPQAHQRRIQIDPGQDNREKTRGEGVPCGRAPGRGKPVGAPGSAGS